MENNRAKQFMPFAALKGYYDLIQEESRIKEPKRDLSEDEINALNEALNQVERGRMLKVTYYHDDGYKTLEGMVSGIDPVYQKLRIVKTEILFGDLLKIQEE